MGQTDGAGTVIRVVRLLQCIAQIKGDVSLKHIAETLSLPPSTVHRLLHILIGQGLVERSAVGHRYSPGLELFRLGSLVVGRTHITEVARPFMQAVVDGCNEICMLVLYLPATRQVMIANSLNSTHPLRYEIELWVPLSLCWGATGRSILAFLPHDDILAAIDAADVSPVDAGRLPPLPRFLAELEQTRLRGYAYTQNQKMAGAVGIGAPIYGAAGNVLGSLCVTIPQLRFRPADAAKIGELTRRQSHLLSLALGFRPDTVR